MFRLIRRALFSAMRRGAEPAWQRLPGWYIRWRLSKQLGDWDSAPRRALREAISEAGSAALEVACGPGIEYEGIRRAGLDVSYIGVDITWAMVRLAKSRFPGGSFVLGDAQRLPFLSGSVDVVFAKDLFEHLPRLEPSLTEMYRVARRRILVYFFLPLLDGPTVYGRHPESGFHYNQYSTTDIQSWAQAVGAPAVRLRSIGADRLEGHLLIVDKTFNVAGPVEE